MASTYTKQIQVGFTFDDNGVLIDGSKDGEKDSRFVGVTYFTPEGERSEVNGKPATILTTYDKMTEDQKSSFNKLVEDYVALKGQ